MSKKQYITPLFEVQLLNTSYLMATVPESEVPSIDFAPTRRTKPF